MSKPMSEITTNDRDQKNGRFLAGNSGGGRKPGARNRLGEAFLEDLKNSWNECGAIALKRAAEEDPAAYCRIVAGLLPRDVNLNVAVDVSEFASRFRTALEMLGNEPALPKPRRLLPNERVIDHD
jgi:hypothetical protein